MKIYKNEENEFIDYENDLVYIMESEQQYVGSTWDDEPTYELYYTDVKECYNYETDIVVNLTEEEKVQILKSANSYD